MLPLASSHSFEALLQIVSHKRPECFPGTQKAWVAHVATMSEHLIGFIEPYRNPNGIRPEGEAIIRTADIDDV
jgi:hypothetical protein